MPLDSGLRSWGLRGRAAAIWRMERLQPKAKNLLKTELCELSPGGLRDHVCSPGNVHHNIGLLPGCLYKLPLIPGFCLLPCIGSIHNAVPSTKNLHLASGGSCPSVPHTGAQCTPGGLNSQFPSCLCGIALSAFRCLPQPQPLHAMRHMCSRYLAWSCMPSGSSSTLDVLLASRCSVLHIVLLQPKKFILHPPYMVVNYPWRTSMFRWRYDLLNQGVTRKKFAKFFFRSPPPPLRGNRLKKEVLQL